MAAVEEARGNLDGAISYLQAIVKMETGADHATVIRIASLFGRIGKAEDGHNEGSVAFVVEKIFGRIKRRFMAEKRMTQTQLVRKLAETCEVSNKVARQFLDTLAEEAIREVKKNGVFVVPSIGRLVRVDRKARMGRNPATGEAIKIPAKKVVKFRVAKAAKDAIVPPKAKK